MHFCYVNHEGCVSLENKTNSDHAWQIVPVRIKQNAVNQHNFMEWTRGNAILIRTYKHFTVKKMLNKKIREDSSDTRNTLGRPLISPLNFGR